MTFPSKLIYGSNTDFCLIDFLIYVGYDVDFASTLAFRFVIGKHLTFDQYSYIADYFKCVFSHDFVMYLTGAGNYKVVKV